MQEPTQTVNYASCHDNMTLFDRLTQSCPDATQEELVKMNNLAAAIYMTSQGIPFIHAGEDPSPFGAAALTTTATRAPTRSTP